MNRDNFNSTSSKSASFNDRKVLTELAKRYREISEMVEMSERKNCWRKLHDLNPEKPMILFEPYFLEGFLSDYTFKCEDHFLRNIEAKLIFPIRQFEILSDDVVLEPYFRLAWWGKGLSVIGTVFGDIKIEEHGANEPSLAHLSNFPIKTPDDIKKLKSRVFSIDREPTLKMKEVLEDIFGDILPVKLGNIDNFDSYLGSQIFTGNNYIGITGDLFKLIGAEKMMLWIYDYPETIHSLLRFLTDDRHRFYEFLLEERLLDFNTDNQFAGPSSYGYVSGLSQPGTKKEVELKDLWTWPESQETQMVSPSMFNEYFLPYIAEIANKFGLSYYGCCETITDRFDYIEKAIHNLRTVSISSWSDTIKAGEILGNKYVYSKKPMPAYVSGLNPNWDLVEKEAIDTRNATKNGCVEIIFRDLYSSNCTPAIVAELVKKWKRIIDI